jgi:hypothetical protein
MADRPDLPKIKPDETPSIFNHEMGSWAFNGNFLGFLASLALPIKYRTGTILAGTALGGLWGGIKGKEQQEKEAIEGRVVKTPGYMNIGIISGWVAGTMLALPVQMLMRNNTSAVNNLGLLGALGGMTIGSISRKNSLQHDFDKAVAMRREEIGQLRARAQQAEMAMSTQPVVAETVTAAAAEVPAQADEAKPKPTHHQDKLVERAAAASTELARA